MSGLTILNLQSKQNGALIGLLNRFCRIVNNEKLYSKKLNLLDLTKFSVFETLQLIEEIEQANQENVGFLQITQSLKDTIKEYILNNKESQNSTELTKKVYSSFSEAQRIARIYGFKVVAEKQGRSISGYRLVEHQEIEEQEKNIFTSLKEAQKKADKLGLSVVKEKLGRNIVYALKQKEQDLISEEQQNIEKSTTKKIPDFVEKKADAKKLEQQFGVKYTAVKQGRMILGYELSIKS